MLDETKKAARSTPQLQPPNPTVTVPIRRAPTTPDLQSRPTAIGGTADKRREAKAQGETDSKLFKPNHEELFNLRFAW
jgi:hypothetical protein